jgi:hypothetical protein
MATISQFATEQQTRTGRLLLVPEGANGVQLDLACGVTRELTQVEIGRVFIFGLLEDRQSWSLIRLSSVLALRLQCDPKHSGSVVAWTRKAAGELIGSMNLPAPAIIGFREQRRNKVELVLLGATKALLATESYKLPYVPFQAISYLEISATQLNRKEGSL